VHFPHSVLFGIPGNLDAKNVPDDEIASQETEYGLVWKVPASKEVPVIDSLEELVDFQSCPYD
jgi:hypothetical protein